MEVNRRASRKVFLPLTRDSSSHLEPRVSIHSRPIGLRWSLTGGLCNRCKDPHCLSVSEIGSVSFFPTNSAAMAFWALLLSELTALA